MRSPRYSIVTPVYDPPADVLAETIESVRAQSFADWELILIDDRSPSPHVLEILSAAADADPRIVVVERDTNGGIVAASNDGLDVAQGEFVGLLDHDDTLIVDALRMVDIYASQYPEMDYCYSDEDLISPEGRFVGPFYKPDWSPERLRAQNYCTHFSVFRRSLLDEIGGFRTGFDGSQDYDIILRASEKAREVVHIPFVLYHWRQIPTSVASGDLAVKPYAYEAGRKAVAEHCARVGIDATVEVDRFPGNYRLRRRVPDASTSVVVSTAGESGRVWGVQRVHVVNAVESLVASTSIRTEIVVVADSSVSSDIRVALDRAAGGHDLRVVEAPDLLTPSERINLGAVSAEGEFLFLLGEHIEFIGDDVVEELLGIAASDEVGAVGAKSYLSDGRVRHGGYVHSGGPHEIMHGFAHDELGHRGLLTVPREVASLSSDCLMMRREVFLDVGGLTPSAAGPVAAIDLGLKLRSRSLDRIWTPHVEVYDFGPVRDPSAASDERDFIERRWGHQLWQDPYSNVSLQPERGDWVEAGMR